MRQHILVISQYFYPEEFRINDICKEWIKRGYQVTVVTGIPNYPQGTFFEGYSWFKRRNEEYEGIRVIRLPLIARGHNSVLLALNYLSFVFSGFFWQLFTHITADKVFVFEVSPMTQALVGVWYARRKKIPCYIYIQDLWPENVEIVTGIKNRAIIGPIDNMVDYIYRNCKGIFATSPSFVKKLEERKSVWNADKSKVMYWPQYAEELYQPVERYKAYSNTPEIIDDGSFKVVFTGNIGQAQGLDILPKVAKEIRKIENSSMRKIKFIIVGDGRNRIHFEEQIKQEDVEDMFFMMGRQSMERIPYILGCCDVAFISFMNDELFAKTIPAKLQSYMACAMPIVASAVGETARIVEEAKCGESSLIGDVDGLLRLILKMERLEKNCIDEMGRNAKKYCQEHFEKRTLMDKICNRLFV